MGVLISGSYEDAELTAAVNHIVDGLVEQVERRLGEASLDHVTSAMTFLLLNNWPDEADMQGLSNIMVGNCPAFLYTNTFK